MNEIDVTKHTVKTLGFIFEEADKFLSLLLSSITQNSNRSFFIYGLYLSIISFSFFKLTSFEYEYLVLLIGSIISFVIIMKNLLPTVKYLRGAVPKDIFNKHFYSFEGEELEKEYLATQIQSYNEAIEFNILLINKMTKRYTSSFFNLAVFVILFSVVFFLT